MLDRSRICVNIKSKGQIPVKIKKELTQDNCLYKKQINKGNLFDPEKTRLVKEYNLLLI